MLGAIVVAGTSDLSSPVFRGWPNGCSSIPVAGSSALQRTVERLKRGGAEEVTVFAAEIEAQGMAGGWNNVARQIGIYEAKGFQEVLILQGGAYVECDLAVLLGWHRAYADGVTRVCDKNGPLKMWLVDPGSLREREYQIEALLQAGKAADFEVSGYVNRLQSPDDVRRFAADILTSRCQARPQGSEVRPGVWIAEGAQVARAARVVAPTFIGRGAKISDECLITRGSSVEANCYVDYGTAVEDSSILPNTYIGIGLDLSHSVVDAGEVVNLRHNVKLQITDPVVMRRNTSRGQTQNLRPEFEMDRMAITSSGGRYGHS